MMLKQKLKHRKIRKSMTTNLIIIAYLNDLKLSTRLVKICQQNHYDIVMPTETEPLKTYSPESQGLAVIDIDDNSFHSPEIQWEIRDKTPFPIIGIIDKVRRNWQNEAAKGEYDLIIPKSLLEQNLNVIISQIQNAD